MLCMCVCVCVCAYALVPLVTLWFTPTDAAPDPALSTPLLQHWLLSPFLQVRLLWLLSQCSRPPYCNSIDCCLSAAALPPVTVLLAVLHCLLAVLLWQYWLLSLCSSPSPTPCNRTDCCLSAAAPPLLQQSCLLSQCIRLPTNALCSLTEPSCYALTEPSGQWDYDTMAASVGASTFTLLSLPPWCTMA